MYMAAVALPMLLCGVLFVAHSQTTEERAALKAFPRSYLLYSYGSHESGWSLKRSDFDGEGGIETKTIVNDIGSDYFGLNATGDRIVYLVGDDHLGTIWVADPLGGGATQVGTTEWPNVSNIKFAKTSDLVLFTSDTERGRDFAPLTATCWTLSLSGEKTKLLEESVGYYKYIGDIQIHGDLFTYRYNARVELTTYPGLEKIASFGKTCETDFNPDGTLLVTNTTSHKSVNIHRKTASGWEQDWKQVSLFDWKTGEYRWTNHADWIVASPEVLDAEIYAFNWTEGSKVRLTFENPTEGSSRPAHAYLFVGSSPVRVRINEPVQNEYIETGTDVVITAWAESDEGSISEVVFYNDGTPVATLNAPPFEYHLGNAQDGNYQFSVVAKDEGGNENTASIGFTVREKVRLDRIEVVPDSASIAPRAGLQFTVVAYNQFDETMVGPAIQWKNTGDGTVDATSGLYLAPDFETDGVRVIATMGGISDTADAVIAIPPPLDVKINFQKGISGAPEGMLVDDGSIFGERGEYTYGWDKDNRGNARNRSGDTDFIYKSLNHMELDEEVFTWEMAVSPGIYLVKIVASDPQYPVGNWNISAEGKSIVNGTPSETEYMFTGEDTVVVTDGRLTIENHENAQYSKLAYMEVQYLRAAKPTAAEAMEVRIVNPNGDPVEGATAKLKYANVSALSDIHGIARLQLPGTSHAATLRNRQTPPPSLRLTNGSIQLHTGADKSRVVVDIFCLSGRKASRAYDGFVGRGTTDISLRNPARASGVYLLHVRAGDTVYRGRIATANNRIAGGRITRISREMAMNTTGATALNTVTFLQGTDTLLVTKKGHFGQVLPISSYLTTVPTVTLGNGRTCDDVNSETVLCVTYPNGGEVFSVGERIDIQVGGPDIDGVNVLLYLSLDNGVTKYQLPMKESLPVEKSIGLHSFVIPENLPEMGSSISSNCRIMVEHYDAKTDFDWSDNAFTISE